MLCLFGELLHVAGPRRLFGIQTEISNAGGPSTARAPSLLLSRGPLGIPSTARIFHSACCENCPCVINTRWRSQRGKEEEEEAAFRQIKSKKKEIKGGGLTGRRYWIEIFFQIYNRKHFVRASLLLNERRAEAFVMHHFAQWKWRLFYF